MSLRRLRRSARGGLRRIDRDLLPVLVLVLEPDDPIDQREQGIVVRSPDVLSGVEPGAALADQDVAGEYLLPAIALHAEVLRIAGPPVPAGAYALLVCHVLPQPSFRSVMRTSVYRCRCPVLRR